LPVTSTDTAVLPRSGEEPSKGRENGEGSQADLETEISIRGLTKSFGPQTVLEDITCDIPKGKITRMLGPSGTGKSVFLKNIMGLLKPERGEIWIDGRDIVKLGSRELYKVRRKFGVLFQDGALFGSMNIYDNVAFPLERRDPAVAGRRALRLRLAGRRLGHQARARIGGMAGTPKQSKPPKQSMLSDSRERRTPLEGVGDFIRSQRQLARLSLRQVAERAKVSNPYLSQIERGIYRPSAEVLKAIAGALDISAETLFARIGLVEPDRERPAPSVEEAIRLDPRLSTRQKETLLSVYRDFTGRD